jgi:hypothetical protein
MFLPFRQSTVQIKDIRETSFNGFVSSNIAPSTRSTLENDLSNSHKYYTTMHLCLQKLIVNAFTFLSFGISDNKR